MNAPSSVSNKLMPAVNSSGSTMIAYHGTADAAVEPASTSSAISVAVSNPMPNSRPNGYICPGRLTARISGRIAGRTGRGESSADSRALVEPPRAGGGAAGRWRCSAARLTGRSPEEQPRTPGWPGRRGWWRPGPRTPAGDEWAPAATGCQHEAPRWNGRARRRSPPTPVACHRPPACGWCCRWRRCGRVERVPGSEHEGGGAGQRAKTCPPAVRCSGILTRCNRAQPAPVSSAATASMTPICCHSWRDKRSAGGLKVVLMTRPRVRMAAAGAAR